MPKYVVYRSILSIVPRSLVVALNLLTILLILLVLAGWLLIGIIHVGCISLVHISPTAVILGVQQSQLLHLSELHSSIAHDDEGKEQQRTRNPTSHRKTTTGSIVQLATGVIPTVVWS